MKSFLTQWTLLWVVAGGLLLFDPISVAAQDPPPDYTRPSFYFGPTRFEKPANVSRTYQESFPLLVSMPVSNPPQPPQYIIQVGTGPAKLLKNAVSVKLNGVLIADSTALKRANPLTKSLSPQATNLLEVVMQGKDANYVDVVVICYNCAPIQVSAPLAGSTVGDWAVTVEGTIVGIAAPELFIVVNGPGAPVVDGRFAVNQVRLMQGLNDLPIYLWGSKGMVAMAIHRIFHYPPVYGDAQLTVQPDHGLAPFEALFQTQLSNITAVSTTVACQGGAPVEVLPVEGAFTAIIPEPGAYTCTLQVTDDKGEHYEDSVEITALSRVEMDARLVGKWSGIKEALTGGNIEQAVEHFALSSREVFRNQFTALSPVLPQIGMELQNVRLVEMTENRAIYDLRREINGVEYSFQVEFVRDEDGIWRLRTF